MATTTEHSNNIVSSGSEASDNEDSHSSKASPSSSTSRKRSSTNRQATSTRRRPSLSQNHIKHFVEHNYHDHANDLVRPENLLPSTMIQEEISDGDHGAKKRRGGHRGGVAIPFPEKLHYMLSQMDDDDTTHVVNWQPHGRCFVVHNPKEFVDQIMPRFFRQTKMTSFQRQLNLYGFSRLTKGTDRGGYYHELFLRGRMDLCKGMVRTRVKGNGSKGASSPSTEPNFYTMEPCYGPTFSAANSPELVTSDSIGSMVEDGRINGDAGSVDMCLSSTPNEEDLDLLLMPTTSIPHRSESWSSFGPMKNESLPIVSPTLHPRIIVSPPRSPGNGFLASMVAPILKEDDEMAAWHQSGTHSGDQVYFEGLPFHYLETKDLMEEESDTILVASV